MRDTSDVSSIADSAVARRSPARGPVLSRGLLRRFGLSLQRGDVVAVAILVVLPVLVFGVPALLGHAVVPGDDLTQNYPLRVLAGRQIAAGQLPLFDPYIWSGAPLLSDWNAGAAYPLTLLFAVLPGVAAWTINLIVTWVVAGTGMFCFLRALRLATVASFLGAISFAFAGAMSAQVGHIGLVAGMSWAPAQLLAVLRLAEQRGLASRLGWISLLAAGFGLTILAGEPRAIDDVTMLVVLYAGWRVLRAGRGRGWLALSVVAGLGLGACLGAVQLLPGLAAISSSQRAGSTLALFSSGSLSPRWLLLMLVPDLLGGSGSFGQPAFFASYQLAEVTSYVGILPLAAAFALLGRVRLGRPLPDWLVWHIVAVVGIVLALGSNTPAGNLLVHLPLFGSQRLQSRNILIADTALAVLLAYWVDNPVGAASRAARASQRRRRWRTDPATVLGLLPPAAVLAVVALGIWRAGRLLGWLTVSSGEIRTVGSLAPSLAPFAILAAVAIGLVVLAQHMPRQRRFRLVVAFVVTDVISFTLLAVVAILPRSGSAVAAAASATQESLKERATTAPVKPVGQLAYPGRFAIYDPGLLDSEALKLVGATDLNVLSATPSVQGYSSIVNGPYAAATGSHQATGDGQDTLSADAIADGVLGQLDTSVLLTVPGYLITSPASHASRDAQAGRRHIEAGQRATWYLGTALRVSAVTLPAPAAAAEAGTGLQIGLTTPGGQTRWLAARAVTRTSLSVRLPRPLSAVAVTARAGSRSAALGPPTVTEAGGRTVVADGTLQNALVPPQWDFTTFDGPFAVFTDRGAAGPLTVRDPDGGPAPHASVRTLAATAGEPTAVAVQSPSGLRITRAVADIPGWTATWQPATGPARSLTVRGGGVVQVVEVPAGKGTLTWTYTPPRFIAGLVLSAVAALLIVATAAGTLVVSVWAVRRRHDSR